ncbi:MAG: hypothetical protein JSR91_17025 [Proteobacteria bacterium]|nr:hypothetical protein [Pseudomonadota bacterium]
MEDKAIIEDRQAVVEADPDLKMLAIRTDAPLAHFRWTLNWRIAEEQGRCDDRLAFRLILRSTGPASASRASR